MRHPGDTPPRRPPRPGPAIPTPGRSSTDAPRARGHSDARPPAALIFVLVCCRPKIGTLMPLPHTPPRPAPSAGLQVRSSSSPSRIPCSGGCCEAAQVSGPGQSSAPSTGQRGQGAAWTNECRLLTVWRSVLVTFLDALSRGRGSGRPSDILPQSLASSTGSDIGGRRACSREDRPRTAPRLGLPGQDAGVALWQRAAGLWAQGQGHRSELCSREFRTQGQRGATFRAAGGPPPHPPRRVFGSDVGVAAALALPSSVCGGRGWRPRPLQPYSSMPQL